MAIWSPFVAVSRRIISSDSRQFAALDFSQSVDVILATFSVLVGVSLADFFDDTKNKLSDDVHDWAFFMLVALLLRYIIGSAIHLKNTYRSASKFEHSASIFLFFKDIAFLIAFGFVAIKITHSKTFFHFMQQTADFILISFLWSITDPIFRRIWGHNALRSRPLWEVWTTIDIIQLTITVSVYCLYRQEPHRVAVILTFVYGVFFFIDLAALLRIIALREPAANGSPLSGSIYLAGPLFSAAEQDFNQALAAFLRGRGHKVFVPQEEEQRQASAQDIFQRDKRALDAAAVVVANMDGPDPDSGTCWECGYAYARGKPVIAFRTDFRAAEEPDKAPYNLMMAESAISSIYRPFADRGELFDAINQALQALPKPSSAAP